MTQNNQFKFILNLAHIIKFSVLTNCPSRVDCAHDLEVFEAVGLEYLEDVDDRHSLF